MGIPGLARRLEPYASRYSSQDLEAYAAIIDGPSLAYHAHKLALSVSAAQSRIPSYTEINNEALKWLNSLEDIGIKVSQILFDGALPESKRAERLSRTEQNNRRIHQFRSNYATVSCPIPVFLGSTSYAFLAPSLREALACSTYASRTQIVPGEADDFCALHAKNIARSMIFTSDTDLLLYGYNSETLVVFFNDAEILSGLKAFSPDQIRHKLQLQNLVQFANVVHQRSSEGQDDLIRDARGIEMESTAYLEFSRRYTMSIATPKYLDQYNGLQETLQGLDVRISEPVHKFLEASMITPVYLPLLVEDSNQASAWNMAQDIRVLAYSLLASHHCTIQEYRRKAQGISPHAISPYALTDLEVPIKDLEGRIVGFMTWAESKDIGAPLLWSLFALGIVMSELNTPALVPHAMRVLNGDFDNAWAFVQLTARLQAALYSLRMLKQFIAVWLTINSSPQSKLHGYISSLQKRFSTFPSIADVMVVPGQTKRVMAEHEMLKGLVEEIYTSLGVEVPTEQVSNKKKKRQAREAERKKKKAEQRQQGRADVSNAFALLDNI